MKILIDHQIFSIQKNGGISRYFYELGKSLNSRKNAFVYSNTTYTESVYLSGKSLGATLPWKLKQLMYLVINTVQSYSQRDAQSDIHHCTYYSPFLGRHNSTKVVVTVFDMLHEKKLIHPSFIDKTVHFKKKMLFKADAIIAISNATKNDICSFYPQLESKITVIYLATDLKPKLYPKLISKRFILYVGNRQDYKNFWPYVNSIRNVLKNESIVLIAFGGGTFSKMETDCLKLLQLQRHVIQVEGSDKLLIFLYTNAVFLVYPSISEGFGLPILEAFNNDCPVLTSRTSSMGEISGNAALLVNPHSEYSMKTATRILLSNTELCRIFVKRGKQRVRDFSWNKTATETYLFYKNVCNNN